MRSIPSLVSTCLFGVMPCVLALGGCSDSTPSSPYPYTANETRVIGGATDGSGSAAGAAGGGSSTGSTADGDALVGVSAVATGSTTSAVECLQMGDVCVTPAEQCGDGATADVIVGSDGQVLSIICYPNKNYDVITLPTEAVSEPALGNNTVVVLDGLDDGVDVEGDLVVKGNNVIVYGSGPDTSVIGGNLDIEKNNAIVRGVRIKGDATISKNNASLVYCVIEGDLTITGNNVSVALCEIWGKVTIEGTNAVFVSNLVAGDQTVSGVNLQCNDNHRFTDIAGDGVIQDDDVLTPITCESRGAAVANDPSLQPGK